MPKALKSCPNQINRPIWSHCLAKASYSAEYSDDFRVNWKGIFQKQSSWIPWSRILQVTLPNNPLIFYARELSIRRPLFRLFLVFSNKQYNCYNKSMQKMSNQYMALWSKPMISWTWVATHNHQTRALNFWAILGDLKSRRLPNVDL